jgi:hypothetical protein
MGLCVLLAAILCLLVTEPPKLVRAIADRPGDLKGALRAWFWEGAGGW